MMAEKFQSAVQQCDRFCTVVDELRMTVVEDRPLRNIVKLVEHVGDIVEDLLGASREMHEAAKDAQCAIDHPMDIEQARRALARCQATFNKVVEQFFCELASYEVLDEIIALGRARRGEWQAWAKLIKDMIKPAQQTLFAANNALFECWQELSERADRQAITVQTTSVGQHIRRA